MRSNASRNGRRPGGDISNAVPWTTFSVDVPLDAPPLIPLEVPWVTYSVDVPLDTPPLIPLETPAVDFFSPAPSVRATSPAPTQPSATTPHPSPTYVAPPGTGVVALRVTPASASVTIDGATFDPSTGHVALAVGRHRLRVSAPGHVTSEIDVEVGAGSFSDVSATLAADTSVSDQSPPADRRGLHGWQWALGLVGAAVVVGGGAAIIVRTRRRREASEASCHGPVMGP